MVRRLIDLGTIKMMKYFLFLVMLNFAVCTNIPEKYSTKYDNVDVDEVLKNDRLFANYFACLMETGKCTPDGAQIRDSISDGMATDCAKCSEKQKQGVEKVMKYMIEKRKDQFKILEDKYDPQGVYRAKYMAEFEKRGLKL